MTNKLVTLDLYVRNIHVIFISYQTFRQGIHIYLLNLDNNMGFE